MKIYILQVYSDKSSSWKFTKLQIQLDPYELND